VTSFGVRGLLSRGVLAVAAVLAVLPVLFLVSLSLRGVDDISNGGWLPTRLRWDNWPAAFQTVPLARMLTNSWVIAIGATLLTAVIAVPTAYLTARGGRSGARLYSVLLAAYCAPPVVAVLPLYFLLKNVGLTNSVLGLALVDGLANVPVAVWLLDGFVRRVPRELEEAAWVDGLSVAAGLVCFFLAYNEFLFAVSFSQSPSSQTLTVGLSLFQGDRTVQFGQQAAASLVAIVPVYLLAVAAQRALIGGLSQGAVK
jgi:multiple sugar transport system permease protein